MLKEMCGSGREGYEYKYRFSVNDEIARRCEYYDAPGQTTLIFETTTVFTIKTAREEEKPITIGSETYYGYLNVDDYITPEERELLVVGMNNEVTYRLRDYWMPPNLIRAFNLDAIDFGTKTAIDPYRPPGYVIPIAADVEVRTVQLHKEPFEEVVKRAISVENLVPLYVWPSGSGVDESKCSLDRAFDLSYRLRRKRFESAGQGLALMRECSICRQPPTIGTQITVLPKVHTRLPFALCYHVVGESRHMPLLLYSRVCQGAPDTLDFT